MDLVKDTILKLAKNNPGGLRVSMELYQAYGLEILTKMEEQNVTGSVIWLLYKDECGENLETMAAILEAGTAYATLKGNRYFQE